MGVYLKPHNEQAYRKLKNALAKESRACVLQPPGTGKSYIALKLIEDNPDKRILWMGPSDYVFEEQNANFQKQGLGLPENVETMTYAMATSRSKSGSLSVLADVLILDEFHHAGAPEWSKGVAAVLEMCPHAKVVGLSATHIRYGDGNRNMADELFGGVVASVIDMPEAWIRGIIPFPKYICSIYEDPAEAKMLLPVVKSVKSTEKRAALEKRFEELRRCLDGALNVSTVFSKYLTNKSAKVIVFCSSIDNLESVYALKDEWFGRVNGDIHSYKTYSSYPEGESDYSSFRDDDSDAIKLLYCINQLNEGVHVDGVEAIVMVRPTYSSVVYKQQLGRVLDAGGVKEPIVFDLVNNIQSSGGVFAYEGALGERYREMKEWGEKDLCNPEQFEIIDLLKDIRFLVEEISCAVDPDIGTVADRAKNLVRMWDSEKNRGLTPYNTPSNSSFVASWYCGKCKGSWQERVCDAVKHARCPFCSGRLLLAGFNDFEKRYPEHALYWDEEKNALRPNQVIFTDNRVDRFWRCPSCGHSWMEPVSQFVNNVGCPSCRRQVVSEGVNDLLTRNPDVADEWKGQDNADLLEKGIRSSNTRYCSGAIAVNWRCSQCGELWVSTPYARVIGGASCPHCAELNKKRRREKEGFVSLEAAFPVLASEWSGKNRQKADDVSCYSSGQAIWKCSKCGHVWKKDIKKRIKKLEKFGDLRDCPKCSGAKSRSSADDSSAKKQARKTQSVIVGEAVPCLKDPFSDVFPMLAKEWVCSKSPEGLTPEKVDKNETVLVLWKCKKCEKEWTDTTTNRVKHLRRQKGKGLFDCPNCGEVRRRQFAEARKALKQSASKKEKARRRYVASEAATRKDCSEKSSEALSPLVEGAAKKRTADEAAKVLKERMKSRHVGMSVYHKSYGKGYVFEEERVVEGDEVRHRVVVRFKSKDLEFDDIEKAFSSEMLSAVPFRKKNRN